VVRRPSRSPKPGRSKVGTSKGGTAIRVAKDGKVDAPCPQCATVYRVHADNLDQVINCQECGKIFPARHAAGRRAHAPDHTKAYVVFGIVALGLVAMFAVLASSSDKPAAKANQAAKAQANPGANYTVGTHPRSAQLLRWAEAVASGNRLVLQTHTDLTAVGKLLGAPYGEADAALKAIASNPLAAPLRELASVSAVLASEADMTAPTGTGILYVVPKPEDARYRKDTRGEIELTFRKESDDQIVVTGWRMKTEPVRAAGQPKDAPKPADAGLGALAGDKPAQVEITDSAGTRKVTETKPQALGHWPKATPEQQKFADQIVADILFSLSDEPGAAGKFTRATLQVRTLDEASAVVPRILNAMFELYEDPTANNDKLSQLNKALYAITGWSVNYQVRSSEDAAKDKAERQSCVRQWFGWYQQNQANVLRYREAEETGDEPR
jgi:hypothetical protein